MVRNKAPCIFKLGTFHILVGVLQSCKLLMVMVSLVC